MNPPGFIDRKNNSREPRPGEIKSALSVKLTEADMREMPGIIQRAKERGWMSGPDENGNVRPLHRRKAA